MAHSAPPPLVADIICERPLTCSMDGVISSFIGCSGHIGKSNIIKIPKLALHGLKTSVLHLLGPIINIEIVYSDK